jgi:hypothetical protein
MSIVKGLSRRANHALDTGLSFLPRATVVHLGNASTELLRAVRAIVDEQITWNGRHVARAEEIRRERAARGEAGDIAGPTSRAEPPGDAWSRPD